MTVDQVKPLPKPDGGSDAVSFLTRTIISSRDRLAAMAPDQNTEHILLSSLDYYFQETLQYASPLESETPEQYTKRMSWAIQAAAIEIAGNQGLQDGRYTWKAELTQEILGRVSENSGRQLPGISLFFRAPFNGYIDDYSQNRLLVTFSNIPNTQEGKDLHVATGYSSIHDKFGTTVDILRRNCKSMPVNPTRWLVEFINELNLLFSIYNKTEATDLVRLISNRFTLITEIMKQYPDTINDMLLTYHRRKGNPSFALSIQGSKPTPITRMYVHPDEVSFQVWDLFKDLYNQRFPHVFVPDHQNALGARGRRIKNTL